MHPSLEFVRLCCVTCRRERVVIAFWADDPEWCDHGKACPWAEHDNHEHGALSLSLVPVRRA